MSMYMRPHNNIGMSHMRWYPKLNMTWSRKTHPHMIDLSVSHVGVLFPKNISGIRIVMHAQPLDFGQKCQFVFEVQPPRVHWHDELRLGVCGSIVSYVFSSFPTLSCWILLGTPGIFSEIIWTLMYPLRFHLEPRDSAGYVMLDFIKPLRTPVPVR